MNSYIVAVIVITFLILLYFNTAATIITVRQRTVGAGIKLTRVLFVWLLPLIGFSFVLRFSSQEEEMLLHHSLIPGFIGKWLYDETNRPENKDRDEDEFKAL